MWHVTLCNVPTLHHTTLQSVTMTTMSDMYVHVSVRVCMCAYVHVCTTCTMYTIHTICVHTHHIHHVYYMYPCIRIHTHVYYMYYIRGMPAYVSMCR